MAQDDKEKFDDITQEVDASELLSDYKARSELVKEVEAQQEKIKEKKKKVIRRNRILTALARANSKMPIKVAATLLGASTLISAILGIYRDRLLNSMYLETYKVGIDAYTVAFTIPDFMFMILVTGALSVTFIPVFNERLAKGNRESAWQIGSSTMNFLALITLGASILIMIFAPWLVRSVVGPGLSESGQALAISMMRVIAINPFLFAISTMLASIQQAVGRFVFFTLSPIVYNVGIIIGALWFTNGITIFGHEVFAGGIMGVALGVVLGAVLQLIISACGLIGLGFEYKFKIFWKNKGFKKVLSLLPPRSLDQGLDYIGAMINTNLASRMAEGTIRAFNQAAALYHMPINLIGVAISTAAFPQMTERLGQNRPDLFAKELRSILRVIIWISLPVAAISFFARGYIVSIVARGGNALIVELFGIMTLAILLRSVYHIATRSFYAQQDSKTPMLISLSTITVTVALQLWFIFGLGWGAAGIAWAVVIWAVLEVGVLMFIMARRINKLFNRDFFIALFRMGLATFLMSIVTYILVRILGIDFENQTMLMVLPKLAIIGTTSLIIYMGLSHLLKLSEVAPVLTYVKNILTGKKFIVNK